MYKKIKKRVFEVVQISDNNDIAGQIFDISLISLIILNIVMVVAETFDIPEAVQTVIKHAEIVSVIIFSVEYLIRLWTSDMLYPKLSPLLARIRYIFSFMAIIDLLSILPFYIPMLIPVDLRVLRALRILRLFRLFKINRYTDALSTIGKVFKKKASELISSIIVVLLLMIISAVIMYNVENQAQPDLFSNTFSAMWWAVATLTTVGYGDIYPVTVLGKLLSAVIALLGIGLVAVPTGIITSGFMEVLEEKKENKEHKDCDKKYCPYCGHKLDE